MKFKFWRRGRGQHRTVCFMCGKSKAAMIESTNELNGKNLVCSACISACFMWIRKTLIEYDAEDVDNMNKEGR